MRRYKKLLILLIAVTVLTVCVGASGCSTKEYTHDELYGILAEAIENTQKSEVYYLNEILIDRVPYDSKGETLYENHTTSTKVNVRATLDKHYEIVRTADGKLDDLRITVAKTKTVPVLGKGEQTDTIVSYIAAPSESVDGNKPVKEVLFTVDNRNEQKLKTVEEIDTDDFLVSDRMSEFTIASAIAELASVNKDEFVFTKEANGGKNVYSEKFRSSKMIFNVTQEFLDRYKAETGRDSHFAGVSRIEVELGYGKVLSVCAIKKIQDKLLGITMTQELESYSLFLSYYGPVIKPPKYDEIDKKTNEYIYRPVNF